METRHWPIWRPGIGLHGHQALVYMETGHWSIWRPGIGLYGHQALAYMDTRHWSIWRPGIGLYGHQALVYMDTIILLLCSTCRHNPEDPDLLATLGLLYMEVYYDSFMCVVIT